MLAGFSVLPVGVGGEFRKHIAAVIDVIEASGLNYKLGTMQTTIEGDQEEVMRVIMQCHNLMMEQAPRVITSITIDDRKGNVDRLEGKVDDVEAELGRPVHRE
jgi:uncharacterized protein (TIGR00106 family)